MTSGTPGNQVREWSRGHFHVSTSPSRIQPQAVNAALDSDFIYWTKPLSEEDLTTMLKHSLCFGLYSESSPGDFTGTVSNDLQIGLARLVTDRVTFAYLTDVYVLPEYQGRGLGKWLVSCVQETLDGWQTLRGTLLYANQGREKSFYMNLMGVEPWVQGEDNLLIMARQFAGSGLFHN